MNKKLSRRTRDRLIAAVASVLVIAVAFGAVLLLKGTNKHTVTFYDGREVVKTVKVQDGETVDKWTLDQTEDGRVFECWIMEDGRRYDFSTPITGDLKLYAKWKFS